jgi:hypothetical protein
MGRENASVTAAPSATVITRVRVDGYAPRAGDLEASFDYFRQEVERYFQRKTGVVQSVIEVVHDDLGTWKGRYVLAVDISTVPVPDGAAFTGEE